ncbi:MAG: pantoate--beta-alanine ligase [Eubacterium sp.]|jgi:pantoate--beta-alanine ligase|nr:pantoate--beta-alanine ligase [Eubacterium sp.]MCH4046135.1 pantoate--beta-alanine ligase [Eubacterium sp.]MCH4079230.1 pantoate--beta-alanine ligase [Eubacterium sp.]MCH4110454.1 pantoate--beta-alanine ligase [Eubacterium sp.]MCI1307965.1 pantoate--beta-alanine ligase [Eubacterium sp.]
MKIAKTIEEVREQIAEWKAEGLTIGLCPTMGFLHEGHASLMDASVKRCDKTVASVFVNPIQFGPTEDLADYPRDFKHDCDLLEKHGVDMVFHPDPSEMYFDDFCTYVDIDVLSKTLCGKTRPIHFRGVCTVITKLLHIVEPDRIFFGQKDAQQLAIIRRMVRDLNFKVEVIGCPIVREKDGLAKSSRNTYLSPEARKAAVILSRAVRLGQDLVEKGEYRSAQLTDAMKKKLAEEPMADPEYVEVVNGENMQPVETFKKGDLVAMAVRIDGTRLIDNFTVGDPKIAYTED